MSFWTQEEDSDDDDRSGGGGGGLTMCPNCGSTDYYQEESSGLYYCSECFTQSQTMQVTTQIEFEEMQVLGARRNVAGGMRTDPDTSKTYKQNMAKRSWRLDPASFDNSKPLPTLKECLFMLQTVLKNASICAARLADLPDEQALFRTSKHIFIQYLEAWREAALWVHPHYPEMRLSFRDFFFSTTIRYSLRNHIAYEIQLKAQNEKQKVKQEKIDDTISNAELGKESCRNESKSNSEHSNEESSSSDDDSTSEENNDNDSSEDDGFDTYDEGDCSDDSSGRPDIGRTKEDKRRKYDENTRSYCDTIKKFLEFEVPTWMIRKRGGTNATLRRHVAALHCIPTISLICGSIVGLALRKIGSGHDFLHLVAWARQGLYPYFIHPRYPSKKDDLHPAIHAFFRPNSLPSVRVLVKYANLICVAIGWDTNNGKKLNTNATDVNAGKDTSSMDVTTMKQLHLNVPLFLARIVSALNIPQHTYDIALCLMNIPPNLSNDIQKMIKIKPESYWLPAPISCFKKENDTNNILTPTHIMAYLAVAIQMTPGWQDWNVHLKEYIFSSRNLTNSGVSKLNEQLLHNKRKLDFSDDDDSSVSSSSSSHSSYSEDSSFSQQQKKKRKIMNSSLYPRFIPWNEAQLNMIGNGQMLEGYVDFLHDSLPNFKHTFLPKREHHSKFLKAFKKFDKDYYGIRQQELTSEKQKLYSSFAINNNREGQAVRPNTVLAGAANPNMSRATLPLKENANPKHNTEFFWQMFHRNKRAIWMDANGYGDYVVYKEDAINNLRGRFMLNKTCRTRPFFRYGNQPIHPHFGFLIEFLAQIIDVETREIINIVRTLNNQISVYNKKSLKLIQEYEQRQQRKQQKEDNSDYSNDEV